MTNLLQPIYTTIELAGWWKYRLDSADAGLEEAWYCEAFGEAGLRLPGTTNENGVGEEIVMESALNKETVRSLRQRYRYVGAVWYQKEIEIPQQWEDKRVTLFLERVMLESRVWIDGAEAGMQDSLSAPHRYELGHLLGPGRKHLLTIRVDNGDCRHIGVHPSAYTDETQTIWNGIIGRMELQASERIRLQEVQVYPDVEGRRIRVKVTVENGTEAEPEAALKLGVHPDSPDMEVAGRPVMTHVCTLPSSAPNTLELEYPMGEDCLLWDEFSPSLYTLSVSLEAGAASAEPKLLDHKTVTFGMREFKCSGTQFEINGRRTFLRGTLDCCIYPLTGYPPMDVQAWERIFRIVKDYGLNHVRFHSWCPPEAAFQAADRIGVYLQAEGPVWMDTWNMPVGSHPEHYRYLPDEAARIIETYGQHPSFCFFSNGNELNGDFQLLHDIIVKLKEKDTHKRQLYTLTANWDRPLDPADDFFIAQTVDGIGARGQYFPDKMADSTLLEFSEAIAKRPVPVISHEVGQYTVYPNMDEIAKYTGCLMPTNFEVIRNDLAEKNLLQDAWKFTSGSGKLAVQLYRDEIEAALRTPGMGGFQLLDLHDFPGQSTATVGILDSFWDSKGLIEPERFRQFCGPTVLLLQMPKRIYTHGEAWQADLLISHFGPEDLSEAKLQWSVRRTNGETLDSGSLSCSAIPQGSGIKLGTVSSGALRLLTRPEKLYVTAGIEGSDVCNTWDIWSYPAAEGTDAGAGASDRSGVLIAGSLEDPGVLERLERGGSVLLLPYEADHKSANPGKFFPVFWSPVHFSSENPCGIYVQAEHPAFAGFPTDYYADYPWKDLLENSFSFCLNGAAAEIEPLVQVIPNFYHNKKLANLIECKVGNGRVMICSMDLTRRLEDRPPARQLRDSLLAYMEGDRFRPAAAMQADQLRQLLNGNSEAGDSTQQLGGKDLAIGREAVASSEMNPGYSAVKGNDGIGHTAWRAADYQPGQWWQVDLGETREMTGTRVKFTNAANYLYVIQVSDDAENWRVAVNQTGQTNTEQTRVDVFAEKARFVKMIYNGLAQGVSAGHYSFEVYGF